MGASSCMMRVKPALEWSTLKLIRTLLQRPVGVENAPVSRLSFGKRVASVKLHLPLFTRSLTTMEATCR